MRSIVTHLLGKPVPPGDVAYLKNYAAIANLGLGCNVVSLVPTHLFQNVIKARL